ncbi:hexosaminidase HEXA [Acrasis kona]|uniref:Beta-hexosaminidase n=1 Tax=Acrasis kona TaxID=1008807 RepID=A0AAW2ZIF0_9EUKA
MNLLSCTIAFCALIVISLGQELRDDVPVWPYPTVYKDNKNGGRLLVSHNKIEWLLFSSKGKLINIKDYPVVYEATKRYSDIIFNNELTETFNETKSSGLKVNFVFQDDAQPARPVLIPTDTSLEREAYELIVGDDYAVRIYAKQQWGMLKAMESLSQLVKFDHELENFYIEHVPVLITDKPRFSWRGLMIDTARHFLPLPTIKAIVDGMSYDKLNVLHIHLIDAQSIPIVVSKYPELGEKARWTKKFFYSNEDLQEIIEYCYMRGISVMPEFDLPGHAYSWGFAYPDARSTCNDLEGYFNENNYPIQPANNITYEIIDALVTEMSGVFKHEYMHLGGDELVLECWQNDPTVQNFVKNQTQIKTMQDLWGYFQVKLEKIYRRNNKKLICWQELLTFLKTDLYKVPKDSIVQVWKLVSDLKYVIEDQQYLAIMSAGYYLDKQKPDPTVPDRWLYMDTWEDMYNIEPLANISKSAHSRLLGIEACQWGEQVDQSVITERIWIRLSGVAERAWSSETVNDVEKARKRIISHRCDVFAKRGLVTTPVRPDFCPYVAYRQFTRR